MPKRSGPGRLPHHKLDFFEKNRLIEACAMEYQRLGTPLRNRNRDEVVRAVREQQPQIFSMIMASEEYMAAMPTAMGFPGFPAFPGAPQQDNGVATVTGFTGMPGLSPVSFGQAVVPPRPPAASAAMASSSVGVDVPQPTVGAISIETSSDGKLFIHDKSTRKSRRGCVGPTMCAL